MKEITVVVRQRGRSTRNVVVALFFTVLGLVFMAGVASAVEASGTGVRGVATWDWGRASLTNIDMDVWDTACDNNDVYIQLRVYTVLNPNGTDTPPRYNSKGCNTSEDWDNLTYSASNNITGVRVVACVDDAGPNTCFRSGFQDNPNV
jgi:hypothetical protein